MTLTYPNKIAWRRYIEPDGPFFANPKKEKDLRAFLRKVETHDITHTILPPDSAFFEWFTAAYQEMLDEKDNALEFDVTSYEIREFGEPTEKLALVLEEGGQRVGATIFFNCRRSLNIAFKTYAPQWSQKSLRIGPSLYSEYLLYEQAKAEGKDFVSLGVDRNPYGPNANIGLATYKLSAGYVPRETKKAVLEEMDTNDLSTDALFFLPSSRDDKLITKATLVCEESDRYEMLLNQKRLDEITQLTR